MALRKIGNTYYYYWKQDGKVHTRTTMCKDKRMAMSVARNMEIAIRNERMKKRFLIGESGVPKFLEQQQKQSGKTRLDEMFAIAMKYRDLSKMHRTIWDKFVRTCGKIYAQDITVRVAVDYLDGLGCKSNKTFNNHKTILNTVFRLCFAETGMESPFKEILNRKLNDVESHRNITEEEYSTIVENVTPFWKFMVTLSYHTGMPKECCLRFCPDWIVEIEGNKWIRYLRGKTARFGRHCQVPLKSEVIDLLPTGITGNTPYCTAFDKPSPREIDKGFGNILERLGIKDNENGKVDFHSLRSSFITNCRSAGIPDHAIRSMVGHVSSSTTDIYSHDTKTPLMLLKSM